MDESAHKKLDTLIEIVTGNGDPSRGIVVKLDRNERLAKSNTESIAALSTATTDFQESVIDWKESIDSECEDRARRLHKRIDTQAVEVAHDLSPVKEDVLTLKADNKAVRMWIRAALWVAAPLFTGSVGFLFYFVKQMLDKLGTIPIP